MKKPKAATLKKKEVKQLLIQALEQTLSKLNNDTALQKTRKTVKEEAKKVTKAFWARLKKENTKNVKSSAGENNQVKHTNKKFIKKLKGKPTRENIKEALKI